MLNHIVLMGRLTRDPELRYTGSNVPVASFSIAVDRDFGRGENGEKQTDFINVASDRGIRLQVLHEGQHDRGFRSAADP